MAAPLRLGLIGAGRWGKVYLRTLPSLGERCRLTHLCTSRPENAGLVPHPVTVVPEWRALIASPCDAVIIATPPATHADILEACLEAGKPCIVEKPLCLDVATAERLDARVRALDIPVLVNHVHLFDPAYQELKRLLAQSGEPVRLVCSEGVAFGPFRPETSALWDWGPHDLGLAFDLLGERPARVDALAGPRAPDGSPEMASLRMAFPSGSCAWVHVGRLAPEKRRTLLVATDRRLYRLDGTTPSRLTSAPFRFAERYAAGGTLAEPAPLPVPSPLSPMAAMLTYFLDGLAGGDRRYFGTALACEIVRVIADSEAAMTA